MLLSSFDIHSTTKCLHHKNSKSDDLQIRDFEKISGK